MGTSGILSCHAAHKTYTTYRVLYDSCEVQVAGGDPGIEVANRPIPVARDLRAKLVYPGELLLAAQPAKDSHANRPSIEIVVEIDQVRFDFRFGVGAERRAFADVRHAAPPDAVDHGQRDVNAVGRQHAVLKFQVGRRKEKFAPDPAPLRNHSFDAVGPSEHAARQIDAARLE